MIPRSVKAPTIPIPFHKLLKVVAIVDRDDPQTKKLLDHIAAMGKQGRIAMYEPNKMNLVQMAFIVPVNMMRFVLIMLPTSIIPGTGGITPC